MTALLRWSLVVVFLWFGGMKFTGYEATGIAPFIQHSPILSWLNALLGVQGASYVIGVLELCTAAALIVGAFSPVASAIGATMSCATYLITLSFSPQHARSRRAVGRGLPGDLGPGWTVPAQGSGAARRFACPLAGVPPSAYPPAGPERLVRQSLRVARRAKLSWVDGRYLGPPTGPRLTH